MSESYYTTKTLKFLTELALNNHREWFESHKEDYEALVREPSLRLIRDAQPALAHFSPHFVAIAKKVGGSLMRVQRDTRFAKDASPYKTNIGIQFRHRVGKDVHAPGLYIHVAPDDCFMGAGVWHPEAALLRQIREQIVERPQEWQKAVRDKRFVEVFELSGDTLKRAPRDFDPAHPAIADLMRKDHIAVSPLSKRDVSSTNLVELLFERFQRSRAYVRFLCDAGGLPM
jgi:uncharacterized protein (TIGR02453 family)